jgi:hypothetical protein
MCKTGICRRHIAKILDLDPILFHAQQEVTTDAQTTVSLAPNRQCLRRLVWCTASARPAIMKPTTRRAARHKVKGGTSPTTVQRLVQRRMIYYLGFGKGPSSSASEVLVSDFLWCQDFSGVRISWGISHIKEFRMLGWLWCQDSSGVRNPRLE